MMKWLFRLYMSFIKHLAAQIAISLKDEDAFENWKKVHRAQLVKDRAIAAYNNEKFSERDIFNKGK